MKECISRPKKPNPNIYSKNKIDQKQYNNIYKKKKQHRRIYIYIYIYIWYQSHKNLCNWVVFPAVTENIQN